jgi:regulator of sigma E protease
LQRALIVGAGIAAFWIIAFLIFAVLGMTTGIPASVSDETDGRVLNPQVRVLGVAPASPAKDAGMKIGDRVKDFELVGELQTFIEQNRGKEIILEIMRGSELLLIPIVPRLEPPVGQGPLGIQLVRTGNMKYSWYEAPAAALQKTARLTFDIAKSLALTVKGLVQGNGLPQGVEVVGPIGIIDLLRNSFSFGIGHFLSFLTVLSVYLAVFNALPIPAVDGGRLFFLGIEAARKKPMGVGVEQRVNTFFFILLITFMIWVSIKDITRLFS